MSEPGPTGDADGGHHLADDLHEVIEDPELVREALTMALYIAISVHAALVAIDESANQSHVRVLAIVWGTAIGLGVAHWYAFRLSARLVAHGRWDHDDALIGLSQLVGAVSVAVLVTVPVAVLSPSAELDVARFVLSAFAAAMGYAVGRASGASRGRALVYGGVTLVASAAIAVLKNVLSGH